MKKGFCFICGMFLSVALYAIRPGMLDVASHVALWKGKRVGLVANQTSVVKLLIVMLIQGALIFRLLGQRPMSQRMR